LKYFFRYHTPHQKNQFQPFYPLKTSRKLKTTVRPGADIRQINAYQFYLEHPTDYEDGSEGWLCGPFVVVSPDDRHAELLAEQGIKFVKYPDFLSE
jgi:hypothetical protein